MDHKTIKRNKAFTLTEVLVAITILAIGIVPVLGLYTSNIKNLISQKEEMISAYISKRIMETIRQFNANS
ncbi:prepilin-type N-terminal cleavage/methylation domain-containing protein, partial [bacterium]|nr:prepilin-type N-terminal cleavage/methylation domain-containing protein [bacterium]